MLDDYTVETRDVAYKGKTLVTVRGLNFDDISVLVRGHLPEIIALFKSVSPDGTWLPVDFSIDALLFDFVMKAPATAGKAIAIGTNEPSNEAAARKLSMPLQLLVLREIVALTFEDIGGPLEFAVLLRTIVGSASDLKRTATSIQ